MMPEDYVEESLAWRWKILPIPVWKFFVRWFGGHYVSDDR